MENDQKKSVIIISMVFVCLFAFMLIYFKYDVKEITVKPVGVFGENRLETVLGQDGVNSIDCGTVTMWTFADTLIGEKPSAPVSVNSTFNGKFKSMQSNTIAFTKTAENPNNAIFHFYQKDGQAIEFIKYHPGESNLTRRFWANDGIKVGGTIYVYYMQVTLTKDERLFQVDGVGIATWNPKNYPWWEIGDPVEFTRHDDLFKTNVTFGDCVLEYKNYIYILGHYVYNKKGKIKIARVNKFELLNNKAYRFLNDAGEWVDDINKAGSFFDNICGELSVSYDKDHDLFIFFYCSLDGKIYRATSKKLEEINTARHIMIYQPEKIESDKAFMLYYSAKEIYNDKDWLYVVYMNPKNYQPILLKVEKPFSYEEK